MTDTNPVNPIATPQSQVPEIKPVTEPIVPTPSVTPPADPVPTPPAQVPPTTEEAASRLKSEPDQAKVLTAQEVSGKPGVIALALVALFVLAGAATAFYLTTLGSAKPQNYPAEAK
jgi:hypothetical protein